MACGECGAPFDKNTPTNATGNRWWHCSNPECGCAMKMKDQALEEKVTALMNRVILQPELLWQTEAADNAFSLEAARMQNEINRELGKPEPGEEYLTALIFGCAAEKYAMLEDSVRQQNRVRLQKKLKAQLVLTAFDPECSGKWRKPCWWAPGERFPCGLQAETSYAKTERSRTYMQKTTERIITEIPAIPVYTERDIRKRELRVAAYCRVSTNSEEQLNSYNSQIEYYTSIIQENPRWKLAGIFPDEGLSGTSTKKRKQFNLMMQKCRRGGIDLIITKSVSRFARNTLNSLSHVRKLKAMGVGVILKKRASTRWKWTTKPC